MNHPPLHHLTYLTTDIAGTGGIIKQRPEDFLVEELPLYQPSGQGEHLYLYLEKRTRATSDVVRRLAKIFHVNRNEVGYAGLKDKQAVTRQLFSVRQPSMTHDQERLTQIEQPGLKLLWSARHGNKLRRGHHAGNRFVIHIRKVDPAAVIWAKATLDRLMVQGVPNFLGEQRFGFRQNNHHLGRMLLLGQWQALLDELLGNPRADELPEIRDARLAYHAGDFAKALLAFPRYLHAERQALDMLRQHRSPQRIVPALDAMQREFWINAAQSDVFNRVLDARLRQGSFARLLAGDLAYKHDSGAIFAVDQATADFENAPPPPISPPITHPITHPPSSADNPSPTSSQETVGGRVPKLEVSPSGPLWGEHMIRPAGEVLELEERALAEAGLTKASLAGGPQGSAEGSRRPLRTILSNADVSAGADEHGPFIRLAFDLPRGSFATVVLREIIKPEATGSPLTQEEESALA